MRFPAFIARVCAPLVLLAVGAPGPATNMAAEASTPSLLWTGARQVAVRCQIQSNTTGDAAVLEKALCARVADLAGRDSPYPVTQASPGDPALVSPDTVVLLVHASIERSPAGRIVAFTIRPARVSEGGEVPFGTPPRAVEMRSASQGSALEPALSEALAEILPWQRPPGLVARPL